MSELLTVRNLSVGYDGPNVVRDINIEMTEGEAIAVLGANGAGKTTFLRAVMGQISPTAGCVCLRGDDLYGIPTYARIRLGLGYAPEGRALFAGMTVAENLRMGARGMRARDREHRLEQVLAVFPKLASLIRVRCQLLSGGEQQMVAVGRALMSDPALLVLDEPSTGLAPRVIAELYAALARLRGRGLAVLVAEQNARAALRFAERAYVFEDGQVTASARAENLVKDSRLAEAYIGRPVDLQDLDASSGSRKRRSGPGQPRPS